MITPSSVRRRTRFCLSFLSLATSLAVFAAQAADAARRAFDLPADAAERSIKRFSEQSGLEVFYPSSVAKGVRTQPVKGQMTPREALDAMLAGTGLVVVRDERTGAFSVKRDNDPNAQGAALPRSDRPAPDAAAQALSAAAVRRAANDTPGGDSDAIKLSPFEVSTKQDTGYVASSTLAGTRFNTSLADTAAAVSTFTPEFLEDIGVTNVLDAYEYGLNTDTHNGTGALTGNDQQENDIVLKVRGIIGSLGRDYFAWSNNSDTYNIERLTFTRGPNSVIFGIGGAGGIINTDSKRAFFNRKQQLTFRVGNHDTYRTTLDVNQPLNDKLALRANLVWQDRKGWRNFEFEERKGVALAATYRPFTKTQVRFSGEHMDVDQNKPLRWGIHDAITPWIKAGRNLTQTAFNQAVPGTTRISTGEARTYILNNGEALNTTGMRIGQRTDQTFDPTQPAFVQNVNSLIDFSIAPREAWVAGPASTGQSNFDTAGLFIEQEIIKDLFIEAAANVQHTTFLWSRPVQWNDLRLAVDASSTRPNGSPNPFAGQMMVETRANRPRKDYQNRWATDYRLTSSYSFNLGKWAGRHQIAAMISRRDDENYDRADEIVDVVNPANKTNILAAANNLLYRTYVAFNGPNPLNLPNHMMDPFATTVDKGGSNGGLVRSVARDELRRVDTGLLAAHSKFWQGRIVTTLGLRHDEQEFYTSTPIRAANNAVIGARRESTPDTTSGTTRTYGVVFHANRWLSLYYNRATNFTPQSGVAWGVDFSANSPPRPPIGARRGEGTDMGVKFNLFNNRVIGSLGFYKLKELHKQKNIGGTTRGAIVNIYDATGVSYVDVAGTSGNVGLDTADFNARGTELELTANLTESWRLHLNFQESMTWEDNIFPLLSQWLVDNAQLAAQNANLPVSNTFLADTVGGVYAVLRDGIIGGAKAIDSLGTLGHVRWTANLFTNYTFREGRLRGFSAGAGFNLRGPQVAGVDASNKLVWRSETHLINASLGYSRKMFGLKSPVRFQFNVNNLLDNDKLRVSVSNGVRDYRYFYTPPRNYALTTTVKF